jgi:hypothetical protein
VLVPIELARPPTPLDVVGAYVTASEITSDPPQLDLILQSMSYRDILSTLAALATLLRDMEELPSSNRRDRQLAEAFREPFRGRAINLINGGRVLITAQAVMGLMNAALVLCKGRPKRVPEETAWLLLALLELQESYGRDDGGRHEIEGITGDAHAVLALVRSNSFYAQFDVRTTLAHAQLRWREIPDRHRAHPGYVDFRATFRQATGVELDDFITVGFAIWVQAINNKAVVLADDGLGLNLPRARVDRALRLISRTPDQLAEAILQQQGREVLEWDFDVIRRFPVVRLYGPRLVVLSTRLVLDRMFSLVRWDIDDGLTRMGRDWEASRARRFWQLMCEVDAIQSLESITPSRGLGKRLYRDDELAAAYRTKRRGPRLGDFVIEYPEAWIVGEVTTSTISRRLWSSQGLDALEAALGKVVDECRQIESTIGQLRANETRLTGKPAQRREFVPLLVMAEGFPVNPATITLINSRLQRATVLQAKDVGPLHVTDIEELAILESIALQGRSLLDVLRAHERGALQRTSLKDFVLRELRTHVIETPERLRGPFERAWDPIIRAVQTQQT